MSLKFIIILSTKSRPDTHRYLKIYYPDQNVDIYVVLITIFTGKVYIISMYCIDVSIIVNTIDFINGKK